MSRTWERLAEAVGLSDAMNWRAVNQRQSMARNGSVSRQAFDQAGPTPYFNARGTGAAQGVRPPIRPDPRVQQRGVEIPFGNDRPTGRPNPLMTPTRGPSPLSRSANSPQGGTAGPQMGGGEEEDEGDLY
jgi:hypothetical protein